MARRPGECGGRQRGRRREPAQTSSPSRIAAAPSAPRMLLSGGTLPVRGGELDLATRRCAWPLPALLPFEAEASACLVVGSVGLRALQVRQHLQKRPRHVHALVATRRVSKDNP